MGTSEGTGLRERRRLVGTNHCLGALAYVRGGDRMTGDRLVCAGCAGPVSEGRCPVCRASRERLRQQGLFGSLSPTTLRTLLVLLLASLAVSPALLRLSGG